MNAMSTARYRLEPPGKLPLTLTEVQAGAHVF